MRITNNNVKQTYKYNYTSEDVFYDILKSFNIIMKSEIFVTKKLT